MLKNGGGKNRKNNGLKDYNIYLWQKTNSIPIKLMPRNIICTSISLLLALTVIVSAWVESAAFMEESTMPKWIYFSFGSPIK